MSSNTTPPVQEITLEVDSELRFEIESESKVTVEVRIFDEWLCLQCF